MQILAGKKLFISLNSSNSNGLSVMDVSRELSSLKRRAARLAVERTVPDLEMPVYFEGEEAPEVKVWELPDGKQIPLSLPVMIEKKRPL